MNNICVNRETALDLKDVGWTKECEFMFSEDESPQLILHGIHRSNDTEGFIEAPTASEIIDELPESIYVPSRGASFSIYEMSLMKIKDAKAGESYAIYFEKNRVVNTFPGKNIAECYALLWIKLKKENLLPTK